MVSKIDIRNIIKYNKEQFEKTKNRNYLINSAILKGLYIVIGGIKGIPLPNKLNIITEYSKIVIKYKMLTCEDNKYTVTMDNYLWLKKHMIQVQCKLDLDNYLSKTDGVIDSDDKLAWLLAEMVCSVYIEDLVINRNSVYAEALNVFKIINER